MIKADKSPGALSYYTNKYSVIPGLIGNLPQLRLFLNRCHIPQKISNQVGDDVMRVKDDVKGTEDFMNFILTS